LLPQVTKETSWFGPGEFRGEFCLLNEACPLSQPRGGIAEYSLDAVTFLLVDRKVRFVKMGDIDDGDVTAICRLVGVT